MNIYKWIKVLLFTFLLTGAGFYFGEVCKQFANVYGLILIPSNDLFILILQFLFALGLLLVAASLVSTLIRPVWVGFISYTISGLAILLGWQVTIISCMMVLLYLLAAFVYNVQVAKELQERISFSVRSIVVGQGFLIIALILLCCSNLYLGCAEYIDREGFAIPDYYTDILMQQMEKQIEARVPVENREEAIIEFRTEFQRAIDEFSQETVKPYIHIVPLAITVSIFMSLLTITNIFSWVPTFFLSLIFPLLMSLRVVNVVHETKEIQRLII
jgi:hypothetical protein